MRSVRVHEHESTFSGRDLRGLGALRFLHPPGTFAPTPASRIGLEAIRKNRRLLAGIGMDWGTGTGCLAIAAARIPSVKRVVGLDISPANVAAARRNARANGVEDKTEFLVSDSYLPRSPADRRRLQRLRGKVDFLLANPPSSEGDDGFGFRREVLLGARDYLVDGGAVFLNVSAQYGRRRVEGLCDHGFSHHGTLASTGWVPFDLSRDDLLGCLVLYAEEERRGGLKYAFRHPGSRSRRSFDAVFALAHFDATGESPLTKWQVRLFRYRPAGAPRNGGAR